ncbi:hypothetical protein PDE_08318 [Penicillium oxalicum 114-2]|uniref:Uncharacterized protein n=1 Tax=Penicillium oxalicum (strain 114-2 / CGMCC 5302) TaxID=933388 RepID=S7ZX86_PENO1|nr:hypothetical protein PDE_08318 [Penicillium oxalicum 114-2]
MSQRARVTTGRLSASWPRSCPMYTYSPRVRPAQTVSVDGRPGMMQYDRCHAHLGCERFNQSSSGHTGVFLSAAGDGDGWRPGGESMNHPTHWRRARLLSGPWGLTIIPNRQFTSCILLEGSWDGGDAADLGDLEIGKLDGPDLTFGSTRRGHWLAQPRGRQEDGVNGL